MLRKRSSVAVSLVIVLLVLILAAVAVPILAETDTIYTGEITESSPLMSYDPFCPFVHGTQLYVFGAYITVGITGEYTYTDFSFFVGAYDSVMLLYTAPIDPANPEANLYATADDSETVTLETGVLYYMYVIPFCGKGPGTYGFTFVGPDIRVGSEIPPEFAAAGAPDARPGGVQFTDDRINNNDPGSPVAAYGHDFEDGHGLVVYTPFHQLALAVTAAQIAAVPECPAENTLIAENTEMNVRLYRLSSCEFQLMAPALDGVKTYVLIFDILYSHNGYTSYES